MNRKFSAILLCFLVQLLPMPASAASEEAYCELRKENILLPAFPPGMVVLSGEGTVLSKHVPPNGDFARLEIELAYDGDTVWLPETKLEAAFALREMLPENFMSRLRGVYSHETKHLSRTHDADVLERIVDLARFLNQSWGDHWADGKGWIEGLEVLLEVDQRVLPKSCRNR